MSKGRGHKLLAAGTATLIAEPVLALAHQGGIGVLVGLAAGAAAYALSDDIEQLAGRHHLSLPARPHPTRDTPRVPGSRGKVSLAHRLFDHKPEYGPLGQQPYLTRPIRAGADVLRPANAVAVGQQIMREKLQVVVDLASYRNDVEAALVMVGLIEGVERWQRDLPNESRLPCTFILDEAHYWLPENEAHSTLRGLRDPASGQTLLAHVQQVFFNLAKVGRSLGEGLIIATQRPADVDKRLISQAEWRFLLKALEPADLRVYRAYGLVDEIAQGLNPRTGDAYVIGPDGVRGIFHLRRRRSPDIAKAPGLANIRAAAPVSPRSPVPGSPGGEGFEQGNAPVHVPIVHNGNGGNAPAEPVNGCSLYGEHSPAMGNSGNVPDEEAEQEGYTRDEEIQVIKAYAALVRTGAPVTRRGIRDYLEWNNQQFSRIIKPVCDKHGIALRD